MITLTETTNLFLDVRKPGAGLKQHCAFLVYPVWKDRHGGMVKTPEQTARQAAVIDLLATAIRIHVTDDHGHSASYGVTQVEVIAIETNLVIAITCIDAVKAKLSALGLAAQADHIVLRAARAWRELNRTEV